MSASLTINSLLLLGPLSNSNDWLTKKDVMYLFYNLIEVGEALDDISTITSFSISMSSQ